MKKQDSLLMKGILIILLIGTVVQLQASKRRFAPMAPSAISDYNYVIANDAQTANNILEFDLYLLDTDASQPFEMAEIQAGITLDPAIYNGGNITASLVANSSQLTVTGQQPASIAFTQAQNCIKIAARTPPGAGNGSIISTTSPGTKICRVRLTNTVPFTTGSRASLTFCFTTSPYPTKVFQYVNAINTQLTSDATNCFSNASNVILNSAPTAFAVTGGGSYCPNGTGLPVGLSNSELGVNYQLYNGAVAVGSPVAGTASPLDFGNQTSGNYTVTAVNASTLISSNMTGSALISAYPNITPAVNLSTNSNVSTQGVAVTFTATPTNGGNNPLYQWYVNSIAMGAATSSNTYMYVPGNGDQISVSLNSDATPCLIGSPVTSNVIIMSVSVGTGFNQTGNTNVYVYSAAKNIYVNCPDNTKQVCIYNALGKMIVAENNVPGSKTFYMNNYPNEYYLVKIVTDSNVYCQKVYLK